MPRGVYDRSKTKAQRDAEKKSASTQSAAPKRRGRKPGQKNAAPAVAQSVKQTSSAAIASNDFSAFGEVRSNLVTLNLLSEKFNDPVLAKEIAENIKLLGRLRAQAFPEEVKKTEAVAKTAPAPQETANGTSAQYPTTVPLPPAPVQVIPQS